MNPACVMFFTCYVTMETVDCLAAQERSKSEESVSNFPRTHGSLAEKKITYHVPKVVSENLSS
jgi:hypothetical protein